MLALDHLAQYVLQNAAVAEVLGLARGVNADHSVEFDCDHMVPHVRADEVADLVRTVL